MPAQDQPKQQTDQQRVDELKRQIQEGEKAGKDVSAMKRSCRSSRIRVRAGSRAKQGSRAVSRRAASGARNHRT